MEDQKPRDVKRAHLHVSLARKRYEELFWKQREIAGFKKYIPGKTELLCYSFLPGAILIAFLVSGILHGFDSSVLMAPVLAITSGILVLILGGTAIVHHAWSKLNRVTSRRLEIAEEMYCGNLYMELFHLGYDTMNAVSLNGPWNDEHQMFAVKDGRTVLLEIQCNRHGIQICEEGKPVGEIVAPMYD